MRFTTENSLDFKAIKFYKNTPSFGSLRKHDFEPYRSITMTKPYPPAYYADYLRLEQLLSAQQPRSAEFGKPAHDEMLFIIVHQAFELWFKQILHELESVCEMFESDFVDEKNLGVAVARLLRITEIQKVMIDQFRILETMTPLDFLEFRDFLSPASGFQSVQFRLIENRLGLLQEQRVDFGQVTYSH